MRGGNLGDIVLYVRAVSQIWKKGKRQLGKQIFNSMPALMRLEMKKCSGGNMTGYQCPNKAEWQNQSGVIVCEHHKLLLDAFTWENRSNRKWVRLSK